jgi:hypothetical protein
MNYQLHILIVLLHLLLVMGLFARAFLQKQGNKLSAFIVTGAITVPFALGMLIVIKSFLNFFGVL